MNESSETGPPPPSPNPPLSILASRSQTSPDSGEVLLPLSALVGRDEGRVVSGMEGGGAWAGTHTGQQALGVAAKGRGPQEQDASVRPREAPASQKSQEQRVQGG